MESKTMSSVPTLVPMPDAAIHRSIARVAARNSFRAAKTSDAELLDEARMTDRFSCGEAEMLTLLRAELARVRGQSKGGHVSAIRRKKFST